MPIHYSHVPATFVNIPKTGTTSLRYWTQDNFPDAEITISKENRNHVSHMSYDEMRQHWNNLGVTFTFVRNPFARLVSMFHHLGQDAEARIRDRTVGFKRFELTVVPIESDIKILSLYKRGFENWVMNMHTQHTDCTLVNAMYSAKDHTIMHWLSNVVPDIVIKIEEVNTEFSKIQKLLGCDVPLPHANTSEHADYRSYYNDNTIEIVGKWFKQDLDTFNYDF